jgi:hypothetical protein
MQCQIASMQHELLTANTCACLALAGMPVHSPGTASCVLCQNVKKKVASKRVSPPVGERTKRARSPQRSLTSAKYVHKWSEEEEDTAEPHAPGEIKSVSSSRVNCTIEHCLCPYSCDSAAQCRCL